MVRTETLEAEVTPRSETTAPDPRSAPESRNDHPGVHEELYLSGRPRLKDFIRHIRDHAVAPPGEGTLVDDWNAAAEVIRGLEKEEAGRADEPSLGKIGPEYERLLIEFLQDPLVRHGFNVVPTDVAFVELDRLVVWQKHVDLTFVRRLEQKLTPAPSAEEIFRACLLHDRLEPSVQWSRMRHNTFVFTSASNDLRFLATMQLAPHHIRNYPPPGDLVGVAGVAVGFGRNFLNAIYAEKRLLLNNGTHRAYALRKMGLTHVPCIVQHVSSREELELVASGEVRRDPDLYLKHPRPPMLADYFNPKVHKVMPVRRRLRQITVKFDIDETYVPVL